MVFNVGKIRNTIQQLGQKLTPQNIQQFGTKVRDTAFQIGRKVSNTLGKYQMLEINCYPWQKQQQQL